MFIFNVYIIGRYLVGELNSSVLLPYELLLHLSTYNLGYNITFYAFVCIDKCVVALGWMLCPHIKTAVSYLFIAWVEQRTPFNACIFPQLLNALSWPLYNAGESCVFLFVYLFF